MAKIVTFYSYKGGTGRSMAVANIAWILATNQRRVLVIDWDLEAPGLHRYFRPFLSDPDLTGYDSRGIIDFIYEYAKQAATPPKEGEPDRAWYRPYADLSRWAMPLHWPTGAPVEFGQRGRIDFIPAGRQGAGYSERVTSFDWRHFYERLSGGAFLSAAKESLQEPYDFVLIDSRTGVSDTSGICTIHLPDALVVCFTLNNQSIAGVAAITSAVVERRPDMPIFPVPMRVDAAEKDKLNRRRRFCRSQFADLLNRLPGVYDRIYWGEIEVPYVPYYAYEEILAPFEEETGNIGSVLPSFENLAWQLTSGQVYKLVPVDDDLRRIVAAEFARIPEAVESKPALAGPAGRYVAVAALAGWVLLVMALVAAGVFLFRGTGSGGASLLQIARNSENPLESALILTEAQGMPEPSGGREFALKLAKQGLPSVMIGGAFNSAGFSSDGSKVLTTEPATLWDSASGKRLKSFGTEMTGRRLRLNDHWLGSVEPPSIVDTVSGKRIWTWPYPSQDVSDAYFSRDGKRYCVVDRAGNVYTFRTGEKYPFLKFELSKKDAALKPDAQVFLSYDAEFVLGVKPPAAHVWRVLAETRVREANLAELGPLTDLLYDFDSTFRLMIGVDKNGDARIWSLDTGATVKLYPLRGESLVTLGISPDGKVAVLYPSGRGVIRLYSGADYSVVREIPIFRAVRAVLRFSLDNTRLMTWYPNALMIWPIQTPQIPESRSWQDLLKDLRASTTACLGADRRQSLLGEPPVEAQRKFEQCETQQGRPAEKSGTAGANF